MANAFHNVGVHKVLRLLLWLAVLTGLTVSIFVIIEEFCLVKACRDSANFVFFGINMGLLGIVYFAVVFILLILRNKHHWLEWIFSAVVFSGVGVECRLLWIQKFVIGSWCPLCVTICISLFITATVLIFEKVCRRLSAQPSEKYNSRWFICMMIMVATGFLSGFIGVRGIIS